MKWEKCRCSSCTCRYICFTFCIHFVFPLPFLFDPPSLIFDFQNLNPFLVIENRTVFILFSLTKPHTFSKQGENNNILNHWYFRMAPVQVNLFLFWKLNFHKSCPFPLTWKVEICASLRLPTCIIFITAMIPLGSVTVCPNFFSSLYCCIHLLCIPFKFFSTHWPQSLI